MERVAVFRERFRKENIGNTYSGRAHFIFITLWCLAGITVCLFNLHNISWLQLLIIPITFLYTNFFEYLGHRFPMHHKYPALKAVFKRHTLQHHHFFTEEVMNCDSVNDFKIILFPPVLLIFFSVVFVAPVAYTIYYFGSLNTSLLFIATTLAYYLNYEWLHLCYHLPESHFAYKIPGVKTLRKLHHRHHNMKEMDKWNFNISYPFFDWIFGTLKK
jgi:hypothetical protein